MTRAADQGALPPAETRETILAALPEEQSAHDTPPEPRNLYIPPRHAKALDLDCPLVVGGHGTGKTVWFLALQSPPHLRLLAKALARLRVRGTVPTAKTKVTAGFRPGGPIDEHPDKDTIAQLLELAVDPRILWRSVIAWQTFGQVPGSPLSRAKTWGERAAWVGANPEEVATQFERYANDLRREGRNHVVIFDALDCCTEDWGSLRRLLKGLFQTLLDFRSSATIRAKAFVRPEMLTAAEDLPFPGGSRLIASKVDLLWDVADLYSLLWQLLGNVDAESGGVFFREACEQRVRGAWNEEESGLFSPAEVLRLREGAQRDLFQAIAGPWMGKDHRRGFTYYWLPNHLRDAHGQVSPSTFLGAIRRAATDSKEHRGEHLYALHYESIKLGVQEASKLRAQEVCEDFPWVRAVMEPLNGLVVPCEVAAIEQTWHKENVLAQLDKMTRGLKPRQPEEKLPGLRQDLLELGLFSELEDGRLNVPDVYRVGFGLGRMGGVKPVT